MQHQIASREEWLSARLGLLKEEGGGTRLTFVHRAMGLILPEHRDGMPKGWENWLERIRKLAERKSRKETL